MSKVDELRQKYPLVTKVSFDKFVEADTTPTKKYLDFMLKTWEDRKESPLYRTTKSIIDLVGKFDSLLPYIENKDIYSKDYYGNLGNLMRIVEKAEEIKEEKTFVREEHANVLLENDKYLFIQPITHKGSMKYGANTRWCTTSKRDPSVFNRYSKGGMLVYLIDKTGDIANNYKKVAFYHSYSNTGLNDAIAFYSVNDSQVSETSVISAGWSTEDLFEIVSTFRYYFIKYKEIKKNKDFVDSFVNSLTRLDFSELEKHLKKLEQTSNLDYIRSAQTKVESFIESINKSKYATVR